MAKSRYAERFKGGYDLLKKIRDEQIGRLQRDTDDDRQRTLEEWVDLAGAEKAVKERYRGRFLFELIQNANDAIVDASPDQRVHWAQVSHLVRLEFTERSLLVANFGKPFGEPDIRALCRLHKTTKSASKQIGHKGIGFKSVLEVSERPEIYSVDDDIGFAFGFDGGQFVQDVKGVMGATWQANDPLPILRTPYPRSLNSLNPVERERVESLFDNGYVTVVRLPWENEASVHLVSERLQQDIQPTLLLFMPSISQIEIVYPNQREVVFFREVHPANHEHLREIRLLRSENGTTEEDSRWLLLGPVQKPLVDRELREHVAELGEAWKGVHSLSFSLAFPLDLRSGALHLRRTPQPFFVYFPTQENSGLRFAVQADFHVGDDRKHLDTIPLNKWLVEEICAYMLDEGMELLKKRWPQSATLVELLAPISRPENGFPNYFMSKYLEWLRLAKFVPVDGGQYKAPAECRFPPGEADQDRFRYLFPASKLRSKESWAYPEPQIIADELARKAPFLLSTELGTEVLEIEDVVRFLSWNGMPPVSDAKELTKLLADWWNEIPGSQRDTFKSCIESLPIFPTSAGWVGTKDELVFQANLRQDAEVLQAPPGFEFSIIRRDVYPSDNPATSNQFKLFDALEAKVYSNRALVQSAVLPLLVDPQRFDDLLENHPDSIWQAYRILKQYFEMDGATTDFAERLPLVPVPAVSGGEDRRKIWKVARDCYLGDEWPSGRSLFLLYGGFEDCVFLANAPELEIVEESDQKRWEDFFVWLGVHKIPRLVADRYLRRRFHYSQMPESPELWAEYWQGLGDKSTCHKGHPLGIEETWQLHHFSEIVAERDIQKLLILYDYLGRYWSSKYRSYATCKANCGYSRCYDVFIDSYFLFVLKNAPWIPALVGGSWEEPMAAKHIWLLGETDPSDVRALVPTLHPDLAVGAYQEFATVLRFNSSSSATIDDYVRLLEIFPIRYPLDKFEDGSEEQRRWHRKVRAVFNWVCERIQTGLVSRGDSSPEQPHGLTLLALQDDRPLYVALDDPLLVYSDERRLAERWKSHCEYFSVNDDWTRLRAWLQIPNLSEVVKSDWRPEGPLERETQKLQSRFADTIPFYLALIKHSQPANYDRLVSRLQRIRFHVVRRLVVEETLTVLAETPTLSSEEMVHLEKTDDPNPRGGIPVRGGDLYATPEILDNPDSLGDLIADYVEISRLGDAFVLLYERDSEDAKMRFLSSKGISQDTVNGVFSDLNMERQIAEAPKPVDEATDELIREVMASIQRDGVQPTQTSGRQRGGDQTGEDGDGGEIDSGTITKDAAIDYPALDLAAVGGIEFFHQSEAPSPTTMPVGRTGSGGSGTWVPVPTHVTEEIGKRAEEWVYEAEKKRLEQDGYDPNDLEELGELVWIAREKPSANYDIRSIYRTDTGAEDKIYIEVKGTLGTERDIRLSRGEFELALSLGENYWLIWVANAGAAVPENPVCYRNLAAWIAENKVQLQLDKIVVTLPLRTRVESAIEGY